MGRDDKYWIHREEESYTRRRRIRRRPAADAAQVLAPALAPSPADVARVARRPPGPQPAASPAGPAPADDDGRRACAVGEWCADATTRRDDDGKIIERVPARSYQAVCHSCQMATAATLKAPTRGASDLVTYYVHLSMEIASPSQDSMGLRTPFGPKLPLRGDVDALLRGIVITLVSWHHRVAALPQLRLSVPDMKAAVADPGPHVVRASAVLHAHLGPLIALEPAEMPRTRDGYVDWPELGGGDACAEILRLHAHAARVLGQVAERPEELLGVRCYQCGHKALVRADPPAKDGDPVMHSRCKRCGHQMGWEEYRRHTQRLLAVAQGRATLEG